YVTPSCVPAATKAGTTCSTCATSMRGAPSPSHTRLIDIFRTPPTRSGSIGAARSAISTRPRAGSGRGRRPLPARNRADRMQIGVGLGPRVLLGDACAELDVRANRLPEGFVVWQAGLVERLHVQSDKAIALLVGDRQLAVDVDDVLKAELAREAVGAAERLGGEPGQVVDMGRDALGKEHLHDRVRERLVVEDLLEAVQRLVSARVFV